MVGGALVGGALTRTVQFAGRTTGQGDNNALIAFVPRVRDHSLPHRRSCAVAVFGALGDGRSLRAEDRVTLLDLPTSGPTPSLHRSIDPGTSDAAATTGNSCIIVGSLADYQYCLFCITCTWGMHIAEDV